MASGIVVEGLDRLLRKLSPELLNGPLKHFFQRSTLAIANRAKEKAPVDTGRLRSSIATEIDERVPPHWGQVGTNVKYAKPMEFGTGSLSDAPDSQGGVHWPPGAALDTWAARHGFQSGYQVAQAIGKRGGLKPRHFFRDALAESVNDVQSFLDQCGQELVDAWRK